jgi:hypothetical protein
VKVLIGFVSVLTLAACSGESDLPPSGMAVNEAYTNVADAISANTEALGGAVALDAVQTMVKRSLIEEGDYRDIAIFATDRQGRMRVDIFADGERVFAESFDGTHGHQWRPDDGQTPASERGTVALSHTPHLPNHIFRLKDAVANGHTLELIGSEAIDDVNYGVLKLTLADGFQTFLFMDSSTGWVTRSRNRRALHVDVDTDQRVIEARMSGFRRVGNIVHPHSVVEVDLANEEILTRITLQSLDVNRELAPHYFNDLVQIVPEL